MVGTHQHAARQQQIAQFSPLRLIDSGLDHIPVTNRFAPALAAEALRADKYQRHQIGHAFSMGRQIESLQCAHQFRPTQNDHPAQVDPQQKQRCNGEGAVNGVITGIGHQQPKSTFRQLKKQRCEQTANDRVTPCHAAIGHGHEQESKTRPGHQPGQVFQHQRGNPQSVNFVDNELK